jgi:hypothetical protein
VNTRDALGGGSLGGDGEVVTVDQEYEEEEEWREQEELERTRRSLREA